MDYVNRDNDIVFEIENYMNDNGKQLLERIGAIVDKFQVYKTKKTEEDFKMEFTPVLCEIAEKVHIEFDPSYEKYVKSGRIDCFYNCVNLEYKVPGAIENQNSYPGRKSCNIDYIDEVHRQIEGFSNREKIKKDKILGIIFDGIYVIYTYYLTTDWYTSSPHKLDDTTLEEFLIKLFSPVIGGRALCVSNLIEDFGVESELSRRIVSCLYNKLMKSNNDKIGIVYEQWNALFSEVSGYNENTLKLDIDEVVSVYGIERKDMSIGYLIYAIQTYYALFIKLLVTVMLNQRKINLNIDTQINFGDKNATYKELKTIENGTIFTQLGIVNFIEEDFFGWYLECWDDELYSDIKDLLRKIYYYDFKDNDKLTDHNSQDLLRKLYNYLMPKTLRHSLGEYYSPNWLAEQTYIQSGVDGNVDKSVLDPTCGSGTFIVIAIKNIIDKNKGKVSDDVLLDKILNNIHGFDLNPLAVITARANYLMALGDLIENTEQKIQIPIYHCDAMLTILEHNVQNHIVRKIATRAGVFEIPKQYCEDYGVFCDMLNYLKDIVERGESFNANLWKDFCIQFATDFLDEELMQIMNALYKQIEDLKRRSILNIWMGIIRNSFIPLFHKKVDFLIGNPPWINWQTLPEDYRESIHKHWYTYKIFDFTGLQARLGNAHDDISVLLTYVVMDNFLKNEGTLAFIINQNLLQAYGGGDGFRKFKIKGIEPVKVIRVEDYVDVEPFLALGASNKTAVIFLKKGEETTYPVVYNKWNKKYKGIIDAEDTLESVSLKLDYSPLKAKPIKDEQYNSAWMIAEEHELPVFQKLVGSSDYIGRKGVDTSANGIYWLERKGEVRGKVRVRNTPENSKKEIPEIECYLESQYLYPLVRGKDIKKWSYRCVYDIIVPYEANMKTVLSKDKLKKNSENLYKYFYDESFNKFSAEFLDILVNRGTYKKHYSNVCVPEYVLYNIGEYTSAPYKVVWKALASKGMEACVISEYKGKMIIPDHNNIMIPFEDEKEAHYLCSILNSKIIGRFIDSYISWFKSNHILENINIPKFDVENRIHIALSDLSIKAHKSVLLNCENKINEIEEQIELLVIKLLMNE